MDNFFATNTTLTVNYHFIGSAEEGFIAIVYGP